MFKEKQEIPLWRKIQRDNFTRFDLLTQFLELNSEQVACLEKHPSFPINVPRRIAGKIQKGTLEDPLLKQFIPHQDEKISKENFNVDPVKDNAACRLPKLLHKYDSRLLILTTSACAMHCRYCFRQHFDYNTNPGYESEIAYLQNQPHIKEVILSGGDPLSLSNASLKQLLSSIESISHLRRLRFHTRFPIGIPERIDAEFLEMLKSFKLQVWFVIHCNHPRELDNDILDALKKIQKIGIPVLNQTVLLKGVNDSLETLRELCETLVDHGILPYYLHQLDRVAGASHFEVPESKGLELIEGLTKTLSGYAVPKYVKEIGGEASKTLIVEPIV